MSGWLLVAGDFTPLGGMDRANHALAKYLAERGPVHLVTHRAWDDLAAHPNVTVHRAARPFGRDMLGWPFLAREGRKWAKRLTGFRVVVNGGNCRWPDVNWVHYVHAAFPPAAVAGWARQVKTRLAHTLALRDERAAIGSARVVVCNSQRTARDATEFLGVDPDRVRVVYLTADTDKFSPIAPAERTAIRAKLGWGDRPWAVFVGGIGDARKGFDTLYTAWRELCKDARWDANLAVLGRGAELPLWQQQAQSDGLADRVRFLGFRPDVAEVLAGCDLMVHPARYESYGLAVHEALCRGLPVLVSTAAGVAERYPPELSDLLLPDPEDAPALADRLRAWRRDLDAWPARVAPLAETLRAYTWDHMAAAFEAAADTMSPVATTDRA